MYKHLISCVIAGSLFAPMLVRADSVVEEIVARVNNSIITRTQYQREEQLLKEDCQRPEAQRSEQECAQASRDVLRGLIDRQLLLEKGKDLGITADTEVVKRLDEIRKQMKLATMEDLEKAAAAQGMSYEDFKQNLKTDIITQQVIQREVGPRINVSNEDLRRYYEKHKAEISHPEQVRLSEILISTDEAGNDVAKTAAVRAKADDILKQIRAGASFEEMAKKESQDPSGAQGGDLGVFPRGKLAKQLEDTTFAMKVGDVSDVIQTRQGFVILKVTGHEQAGTPAFKDVEDRVRDAVFMQKMQPAMREYLKKLREQAYVDVKPGYVDTGASSNQTKPVVTTAAKEANAKELKKRKKVGLF